MPKNTGMNAKSICAERLAPMPSRTARSSRAPYDLLQQSGRDDERRRRAPPASPSPDIPAAVEYMKFQ